MTALFFSILLFFCYSGFWFAVSNGKSLFILIISSSHSPLSPCEYRSFQCYFQRQRDCRAYAPCPVDRPLLNIYKYTVLPTLRPSNISESHHSMNEAYEASTCEAEMTTTTTTKTKGPNNAQLVAIWFAFTLIFCAVLFLVLYIVRRKLNLKHLRCKDLEAGGDRPNVPRKAARQHVRFRDRLSFIPDASGVAE